MEPIKDIIGHVIGRMAQKQSAAPSLVERWQRVAGSGSRPSEIKQSTLIVHVDTSARLMHLHTRKASLIEDISKDFPQIKDIRFKVASLL